jgi:2'-5' RNA ligase
LTRDGHEPVRRLFFALWPDETERQRLVHATAGAAGVSGGRLVPAESLHVTLAFLGSVPERRIPDLHPPARQVAKAFAQDARPPPLRFDRVAHWAGARILCALAADEARALALAAALRDTSAAAGFSPDLKPFHPHVTVARKVVRASVPQALHPVLWRFDAFTLLDSHSAAAGPVYSVIESYPLFKTENARA